MHVHLHVQYALSLKKQFWWAGTSIVAACEGPCMLSTFKHVECIICMVYGVS